MSLAQRKALDATLAQYLQRYAEAEAFIVSQLGRREEKYQYCLCVPFYNESFCALQALLKSQSNESFLLIAVINQPDSIDQPSSANVAFQEAINRNYILLEEIENLALYHVSAGCDLLVVDRFSEHRSIPAKQGVGLARKLAADIAATLIYDNRVDSNWIFCSDADAQLPTGYFKAANSHDANDCGALVYPYTHQPVPTPESGHVFQDLKKVQRATEIYELCLRQYEEGLRSAGSPYAYQTLGSTLCLSVYYYAIVRGFPTRNAAEDFYILNKLQKVAGVRSLEEPTITLESRLSDRTPFGTGIAVTSLVQSESMLNELVFYHPVLFGLLKSLLMWFKQLTVEHVHAEDFDWKKSLRRYLLDHRNLVQNEFTTWIADVPSCEEINDAMLESLELQGFTACMEHCIKQCKSQTQLQRHLPEWFDAFRTLKWLHMVRAGVDGLANLSFSDLFRQT